jgi:hypothetical protein
MRRVAVALLALCFAMPSTSPAQVTLGLKAGLNVSDLDIEDAEGSPVDVVSRTGFVGGAYLQAGLGSVLTLQTEALSSPKGGSRTVSDRTVSLDLTYIDVPVLLLVRVPAGDSAIWPVLYAGPVFSWETRCRIRDAGEAVDCAAFEEEPLETKSPDVGMAFGGGFEIFMGSFTLQLEARYNLGLTTIDDATEETGSVKNRTWSFMLGVGRVLTL